MENLPEHLLYALQVEVFSVRINEVQGRDRSYVHGEISVIDGQGSEHIYNRTRKFFELIRPGKNILLTSPARPMSAYDEFVIDVALTMDKGNGGEIKGDIGWNPYDRFNKYDQIFSCDFDSEYGSVTVKYAVFKRAVTAIIEVKLLKDGADVYGKITLRYGKFVDEDDIVLFRRTFNKHKHKPKHLYPEEEEIQEEETGGFIPLSRPLIAVPRGSSLLITADLWDRDRNEIAKGTAIFCSKPLGTSEEIISGNILVKVTWKPSFIVRVN